MHIETYMLYFSAIKEKQWATAFRQISQGD